MDHQALRLGLEDHQVHRELTEEMVTRAAEGTRVPMVTRDHQETKGNLELVEIRGIKVMFCYR